MKTWRLSIRKYNLLKKHANIIWLVRLCCFSLIAMCVRGICLSRYYFPRITLRSVCKPNCSIPKVLWCFWTGTNTMSPNRYNCLKTMNNSGLEVILVTPSNLHRYILPEAPLHEGYQYLSETHKSDYLRAYFMHFYGGGYSDIKNTTQSWNQAWNDLNTNKKMYANGYREVGSYGVAQLEDPTLTRILRANWKELNGNGCYIFRSRTWFTMQWYTSVLKVMDSKLEQLKQYPSKHPQQVYSEEYPYPFRWAELLAEIYHPLCWKFRYNILQTVPMPSFVDYR